MGGCCPTLNNKKNCELYIGYNTPNYNKNNMGGCCSVSDNKSSINYNTLNYDKNNISECVICREDLNRIDNVYVSKCCKSVYHVECILQWKTKQNACPVCRHIINI